MYAKLLVHYKSEDAGRKSFLTNEEIITFFNFFYWIMLKLVAAPFCTIYLLGYFGGHAHELGGTYTIIVLSATVLLGCDIKVAVTMFKAYK